VKEAHKLIVEKLGHPEVLIYNAGRLSHYSNSLLLRLYLSSLRIGLLAVS